MAVATAPGFSYRDFQPRGVARDLFACRAPEVVLSGPAGTGKTRASLEKLHLCLLKYPGARALMLRKTHASLTGSALVTYREHIRPDLDDVQFYGGSAEEPPQYRYPNGARLLLGGMDKATKVLSTEYDLIYWNEATEGTEAEWETLTTRLRWGRMPYQQLIGDCNPDAPTHWVKLRADRGAVILWESRHVDNPSVTPAYLATLDALTGVRRLRLRDGIWAAAEGLVYDGYDPAVHLLPHVPYPAEVEAARRAGEPLDPNVYDARGIPRAWPRFWVVDFGYTNPFGWQAWAQDGDGRLYRYREIYFTQRIVEDHARDILAVTAGEPAPVAVICDHDAEGRATFERYTGYPTYPAYKAVQDGIQAVQSRLRPSGDGRPRLFLLRDSLVERDPRRVEANLTTCTEDEFPAYVWDTRLGRKRGEEPFKEHDHGMDMTRYLVAAVDGLGTDESAGEVIVLDAGIQIGSDY